MKITSLSVRNYRNIEEAELTFTGGVNLLFGANAQGKTNVLEAIYSFARGKSFRGASDTEQVLFGRGGFSLSLGYESGGRGQTLSYRYENGTRERKKNGAHATLREMIGSFRAVLFHPEHLQLVKGGPSERRAFLNIAISQIDPLYMHTLGRYQKILENRNSLLRLAQKTGEIDTVLLDTFTGELCREAALLYTKRQAYIDRLQVYASPLHAEMSDGRETLTLSFCTDIPARTDEVGARDYYLSLFSENGAREMGAGTTLFGPHRDDLSLFIGEREARVFASQGQQRTAVLALKMAEGEVSREECGEYPVFLFDDVLSELDARRRAFVLAGAEKKQMLITACDRGEIGDVCPNVIYVEGGRYDLSHRTGKIRP